MSLNGSVRLALCAAVSLIALAGSDPRAMDINGFLRQEGRGDVALSYTSESYDEFWVGEEKVSDPGVGEVDTRSLSLWIAWGLTDRLTLVGSLPYVDVESDGLGGFEEDGLQDISMLGLYQFGEFGESSTHRLVGGFGFRTIASNYVANQPVDIGDGTSDWLFRFVYQFERGGFYASQQIGYDNRGGDAPSGFPLYTEVGMTWGAVTASAFYQHLDAKEGTDIGDPGFTFPSNEEEYEKAGAKVYGRISESFGLSGMYFTTLDGRNTGDSSGVSAGVVYSFGRDAR